MRKSQSMAGMFLPLLLASVSFFGPSRQCVAVDVQTIALSDQIPVEISTSPGKYSLELPAIADSGDVIYFATFEPEEDGAKNVDAIWKVSADTSQLIVKTDDDVHIDGHSLSLLGFGTPVINSTGEFAFYGETDRIPTPDGVTINFGGPGIWKANSSGKLENIALRGQDTPESDFVFRTINHPQYHYKENPHIDIGPSGEVVFTAHLKHRSELERELTYWSTAGGLHRAYTFETPIAVEGFESGIEFDSFEHIVAIDEHGQAKILSHLWGPDIEGGSNLGILSEQSSSINLDWQQGTTTPGIDQPFMLPASPQIAKWNEMGQTLVLARIGDDDIGLVLLDPEGLSRTLAITGDLAPDTPWNDAKFGTLNPTDVYVPDLTALNNSGHTAFMHLAHSQNASEEAFGLWVEGDGATRLVAMGGMPAPGIPGAVFSTNPSRAAMTSAAVPSGSHLAPWFALLATLSDSGQLAFQASVLLDNELSIPSQGIWAEDPDKNLKLIAKEGDIITVAPGDDREIVSLNLLGQSTSADRIRNASFNRLGQLAFKARFTDGTEGIFLSNAVAVPEPSGVLLILSGILCLTNLRTRKHGEKHI